MNFRISDLVPGRYVLAIEWVDPETGLKQSSRRRLLAIYRGDESPLVRQFWLTQRAKEALALNSRESFETARKLLLEAAGLRDDPKIYESLGDAAAPWQAPEETARYYQNSVQIARLNLERKYGKPDQWPERVRQLHEAHSRKVSTFETLVPWYKLNFGKVRVVHKNASAVFIVERRTDGVTLREIKFSSGSIRSPYIR